MRSLLVVAAFSLFLVACGNDPEIGLSNQPIPAQMRAVSIRVQHTSVNIGDRVDVMLPDSTVVLGNVEVSNLARVDSHVDIALFIVPPEDAERLVAVSKPSGFRLRSTSKRLPYNRLKCTGLLFHDLRRGAARNLVRDGTSEKLAMENLSQTTRDIFDRYNISSGRDREVVAAKMEQRIQQRTETFLLAKLQRSHNQPENGATAKAQIVH